MHKAGLFIAGVLSAFLVAFAAVGIYATRAGAFSARERPTTLEQWIARRARAMAVAPGVKALANPVPDSPETLKEAREHWADHCAGCHANNGGGDTEMGKRMYPPAPDMRGAYTQQMTDGELFFVIQNGIRMSGMPGWGGASNHDEQDSWKLVRFIRHLPRITRAEEREMQSLNPKTPADLREEQEEREFLNGEEPHDHSEHEHHH
jgi:mono/diheme cytochrome c family protein